MRTGRDRPAPHALSTGVNAFCRCRRPNPLDLPFPRLARSPAAARAWGLRPTEVVLSLTSQIPRADRTLKPGVFISTFAGKAAPPASSRALGCTTQRLRPVMDQL